MLDWDDLRFFLAVARNSSLSSAAKSLHVAQSTVGRRLASLETSLGVRLLNRTPEGYVPTLAGDEVRKQAERVEAEALALERQVIGRDTRLAGLVRVTCSETIASNLIAPCLGTLHVPHPDIMIELIPNARELSLSMREADISVRLRQPEQHDLVVRRIGVAAFGLYASGDYLARHGDLDVRDGCPGHHLITQLDGIQDATQTDWLAELAPRARIAMQTSSHSAALAAAVQGGGLASLLRFRADREPGLIRLTVPPLPSLIPSAGIWLVVHKDNRETPRIRVTLDHITKWVRGLADRLDPAVPADIAIATGAK
ncbi:LysR family transcriptional regulator [Lichenifustis flavocetrariae]|uniref:LysR family transcriptional regulator n=1 Tax=Lichenifustis flavocetrariae TaxID=2949735 RepID=A0AA41YWG6_9HYPH|nr:LysR family transcriptional regulator [Lichenifustis flavocetrariae]MCW6508248.1 LysR family transcriptional regulator [Lichenifustis flavocetrariae]